MAQWRYKILLNETISRLSEEHDLTRFEEPCPEVVKTDICAELNKAAPLCRFVKDVEKCKTIAALNRLLVRIFDEADRSLVWCGFSL